MLDPIMIFEFSTLIISGLWLWLFIRNWLESIAPGNMIPWAPLMLANAENVGPSFFCVLFGPSFSSLFSVVMILELVTIKNEILKVPNLKLVFLTFERSEIWQKLQSDCIFHQILQASDCGIMVSIAVFRSSSPGSNPWRAETLFFFFSKFCQISLLSKVRKTSLRLGTSKISF